MGRVPDSTAKGGQRIEQELDAVTDTMRRQTREWIHKVRRSAPNDQQQLAAIIGGIAGGLLDELYQMSNGDAARIIAAWESFVAGYIAATVEQAEADKEPITEGGKPNAAAD